MKSLHLPGFDSADEVKEVFCVDVAVPLPLPGAFSYKIPAEMDPDQIPVGSRVLVPFRNREIVGYIVGVGKRTLQKGLKEMIKILDPEPVLSKEILELTQWVAASYGAGWGEAIENALPKWVKYGKKADRALKKEANNLNDCEQGTVKKEVDFELTEDQRKALQVIREMVACGKETRQPILMLGVTGSGKSECYIRIIRETLAAGRSSICLVPEIALTEQLRLFFKEHFGEELEILHSKLNDTERFLAWKRIESGRRKVILGPRSAVFAPVPNLGLIIIDEEHENSYKQETSPRYHAREVAEWRCRNEDALFIMGSATPSLETMSKAQVGNVRLIEMSGRVANRPMPKVEVLDMKVLADTQRKQVLFSPKLASEIQLNLDRKEGTLLLLNRRGFSTYIHCKSCGMVESCPHCEVSLTFHHSEASLVCHYCNYMKPVPTNCVECKAPVLKFGGFGTEKIESEIANLFPSARVARMDTDTIRKKGSHEVILDDFRKRKIDILIGTQMIAKGFDFHHVTLVGVVMADVGLMLPDFRSAERTFQLLTQVAGRAGRGEKIGRVYVQTYSPNHPSIKCAQEHDFKKFFQHEVEDRKFLRYPPHCRLYNIIIRGKDENRSYQFGRALRVAVQKEFEHLWREKDRYELMGPAPLPFYRLRGQFRWHLMMKAPLEGLPVEALSKCLNSVKKVSGVAYALDVDPLNIL